jgi:hypothetical protein
MRAMQNVKILIKTDELLNGPQAARELEFHFTTVPRLIKKSCSFSFPTHGANCPHVNDIKALNLEINEGQ